MKPLLFYSFLALFLFSCGAKKQTVDRQQSTKEEPEWLKSRPISSLYYIGIGKAQKKFDPVNYTSVAKRSALNDLASEISVTVDANSLLYSLERNNNFRQDYMSSTKLKSSEKLSGYEVVDSYETEEAYYLYYRLDKATYQQQKRAAVEAAKRKGLNFYGLANQDLENGNVAAALRKYVKAIESIQEYLNEPLEIDYQGQSYLGSALIYAIEKTLSDIRIQAPAEITLQYGQKLNSDGVPIQIKNQEDKPIVSTPFLLQLGPGDDKTVYSSISGKLIFDYSGESLKASPILLNVSLNNEALFQDEFQSNSMLRELIRTLPTPKKTINITLQKPALFVVSEEKNLARVQQDKILKRSFESEALNQGYRVVKTNAEADLRVEVESDTRQGGESFGMFTSFLNGKIDVYDAQSNEHVFGYPITEVKGAQLDFQQAGKAAYQKVGDALKEEFFPKFNGFIF